MNNLNIPFTVICSLSSILLGWYGAYTAFKKSASAGVEREVKLEAQVDYIYKNVAEIKEAINISAEERKKLSEKVIAINSKVDSLEKRMDKLEEKI